jgi:hypothetical protein
MLPEPTSQKVARPIVAAFLILTLCCAGCSDPSSPLVPDPLKSEIDPIEQRHREILAALGIEPNEVTSTVTQAIVRETADQGLAVCESESLVVLATERNARGSAVLA